MLPSSRRRQCGVAIVEFALIVPILILLSVITVDLGRAFYQFNTIAKALRDASRYLSVQDPAIKNSDPSGRIATAKNLIVYGNPGGTGNPIVPGLAVNYVNDPVWAPQTNGTAPNLVTINTVTITLRGCGSSAAPCYRFTPMFASVFGTAFSQLNHPNISATMRAPL